MQNSRNISFTVSRAQEPGLRFMAIKGLSVYISVALVVAVFFSLSGFILAGSSSVFLPPKAFASMGGVAADGARAYSESEERYILRAVSSNPDNLIKLDSHGVEVVLGQAEMVRADLPTVLWQYRTNRCVLDIYFRAKNREAKGAQVVHYETRSRDVDDSISAEECLAQFIPQGYGPRMVSVNAFYKSYIQ